MEILHPRSYAVQQDKFHEHSERVPFIHIADDGNTVFSKLNTTYIPNSYIPNGATPIVVNEDIPRKTDDNEKSSRSGSVGSKDSGLGSDKREEERRNVLEVKSDSNGYPTLDDVQQLKDNSDEHCEHVPSIRIIDGRNKDFSKLMYIPNGFIPNGAIPHKHSANEDNLTRTVDNEKSTQSGSDDSKDTEHGRDKREEEEERSFLGEKTDSNTDDTFWKKVLIIFSILDVLLFITILVVAVGIPSHQPGQSALDDDGHCLPCMDVYLTDDDKLDNIYDFQIKDDLCCSENQTKLIQKYVIKRYRSDQAKESAKNYVPQRTAVHLPVDETDTSSTAMGANQVLKWMRKGSLINGNLSLSTDGREIVVKRAGIYYISPKVVFRDGTVDVVDKDLLPMLLQVVRKRSGEEQVLLENKHTHCANSGSSCDVPSSSQGVFRLNDKDTLIVRLTKPCGLALESGLNYIDVYMI